MSVEQLESAVSDLPPDELARFSRWFEEYMADQWDRQIEADVRAGHLDALADEAIRDLREGRCRDL